MGPLFLNNQLLLLAGRLDNHSPELLGIDELMALRASVDMSLYAKTILTLTVIYGTVVPLVYATRITRAGWGQMLMLRNETCRSKSSTLENLQVFGILLVYYTGVNKNNEQNH